MYNKLNSLINIYSPSYMECENKVTKFLQNRSYDDTEKYMIMMILKLIVLPTLIF